MPNRLTYLINNCYEVECSKCPLQHKCSDSDDCINILSDTLGRIEDKIDNGYLIEVKAKVGDTVWVIVTCNDVEHWRDGATGYTECSLECECYDETCEQCNPTGDPHIIRTHIKQIYMDENEGMIYLCNDILIPYTEYAFGATVFTNEEDAHKTLKCLEELIDESH
jgi:hypothetical protein